MAARRRLGEQPPNLVPFPGDPPPPPAIHPAADLTAPDTGDPEPEPLRPPPPAPPPPPRRGVTATARVADEIQAQRLASVSAEATENIDRLRDAVLSHAGDYKIHLVRDRPTYYNGQSAKGLLETYDHFVEIDEIMRVHGGEQYHLEVYGPNPDDPLGNPWRGKRIPLPPIVGAPKTFSSPDGPKPMPGVPSTPPAPDPAATVLPTMMKMMGDMMAESRREMRDTIAALTKTSAPVVDVAAEAARADARQRDQHAHDLRMLQMKTEADERAAAAARLAQAEERRAAEALKQAEIAANKEIERMKIDAQTRHDEAEVRKAETQALMTRMEESNKQVLATIEKMVDKMADNDPLAKLDQLETLRRKLTGEEAKEPRDLGDKIIDAIPGVSTAVKEVLKEWRNEPGKPAAETKPAPPSRPVGPGTTMTADLPPEADPGFEWPPEGADVTATAKLLGANIEKAMALGWRNQRIYGEMVTKFPAGFLSLAKSLSVDKVIDIVEQNAPDGSALRTPKGEAALRHIHRLVVAG